MFKFPAVVLLPWQVEGLSVRQPNPPYAPPPVNPRKSVSETPPNPELPEVDLLAQSTPAAPKLAVVGRVRLGLSMSHSEVKKQQAGKVRLRLWGAGGG